MPSDVTQKILERIGEPGLFQLLTDGLTGTELNTLLLDVVRDKAKKTSAPSLLNQYELNRFVKPADLPVIELKQTELDLLKLFKSHLFEPTELSPVSILGSCAAVGPTDQNNVLSALRGTEVLADATNAMALHICHLKKRRLWQPKISAGKFRLSTIQRHVRTQTITAAGFTPHFKIGCLVTSGIDTGDFTFEKEALLEQLRLMNAIYNGYYGVQEVTFRFLCRKGYQDPLRLAKEVKAYVQSKAPEFKIDIVERPEKDITYYKGLQYKTDILWKGKIFEIADGGFVDWTQKVLQNKKERFLIGGIGFEFMFRVMNGML
jgi:hypothetical protein